MTPLNLMKLLADDTRLSSVMLLLNGPLCVCDLMEALQESQPKVSRHLALLREGGLVESEKRGQWVYYSLASELPAWVINTLTQLLPEWRAQAGAAAELRKGGQLNCC